MKTATFQAIAAKLASTMGRREGVTVHFGGNIAHTDGRTIHIPNLPAGTVLTPGQALVFGGYVDHETAHVRHTDFRTFKLATAKALEKYLTNLFEDVRIENDYIDYYPGTKDFLDALADHVDSESERHREEAPPPNAETRALALTYKEAWKYRGIDTKNTGELRDDPALAPIADLLAQEMPRMRSTANARALAQKVVELLKTAAPPEPQPQTGKGDGPKIAVVTPTKGKGDGEMTKEQAAELTNADAIIVTEPMDEDELEKAAEDRLQQDDRAQGMSTLLEQIANLNEKLGTPREEKEARKRQLKQRGDTVLPPGDRNLDKIYTPAGRDPGRYQATKAGVAMEIKATRKMLNTYLRSRRQRAWTRGLEDGTHLDTDALHLLSAGDNHVTKDRRARDLINTAVHVLVDCSSSMDSTLTPTAAILIAEAMAGVPTLKLEIAGFTTNRDCAPPLTGTGRLPGMDLLLYKGFDEPYDKAKTRLGALRTYGWTPLGDAYGNALERILPRREHRRVIWVVTDGMPEFSQGDNRHDDRLLMKQVHEKCRRFGIETVGVYIGRGYGGNPLTEYFDWTAKIETPPDLPKAVLALTRELVK